MEPLELAIRCGNDEMFRRRALAPSRRLYCASSLYRPTDQDKIVSVSCSRAGSERRACKVVGKAKTSPSPPLLAIPAIGVDVSPKGEMGAD